VDELSEEIADEPREDRFTDGATHQPVLSLAFADEFIGERRCLRNLPAELRQLRETLDEARKGLCRLEFRENANAKDVLDVSQSAERGGRVAYSIVSGTRGRL
jgi:hypothetical protein